MTSSQLPSFSAVLLTASLLAPGVSAGNLPATGPAFQEVAPSTSQPGLRHLLRAGALEAGLGDGEILLNLKAAGSGPGVGGALLRLTFPGARSVRPQGLEPLPGRHAVIRGADPAQPVTGLRRWAVVEHEGLLPGIDLIHRADARGLKYDLRVAPGADLDAFLVRVEGAEALRLDGEELVFVTAAGELRDAAPVGLEEGRRVDCAYRLVDEWTFGFDCPGWSGRQELLIDPLIYATLLGRSEWDRIVEVVVDAEDRPIVVGYTDSVDFPTTPGAYDRTVGSPYEKQDVFVARFSADGSTLEWSTLVTGWVDDRPHAVALTPSGDVVVVGWTNSLDFPTTTGSFQPESRIGFAEGFVFVLSDDGSTLRWGSYLGGTQVDYIEDVAVDDAGRIHVVGSTWSPDFPVTAGSFDEAHGSGPAEPDTFVTRIAADGSALDWSTLLGGDDADEGKAIGLHGGEVLVTGSTASEDFPTTAGAWDRVLNDAPGRGQLDVFVTRLDENGSVLRWSTLLGGRQFEHPSDLAVDSEGHAVVVGAAGPEFTLTPGALDTVYASGEGFVARLDPSGSSLVFSTYIGGALAEQVAAVALDARENIVVTGSTDSDDLPVTPDAHDMVLGTTNDVDSFVSVIDPCGTTYRHVTYLGVDDNAEHINSIAVDSTGAFLLAGTTSVEGGPEVLATPGAYQELPGGHLDGLLAKLDVGDLEGPGLPCAGAEPRCPRTQGFWKTHPDAWPVARLPLGDDEYSHAEALELLWTPPRADASLILAHQLIAAELNAAAGVDATVVADALAEAHALLELPGLLPHGTRASSPEGRAMTAVAEILAAFNEGALTVGDCEEIPSGGRARPDLIERRGSAELGARELPGRTNRR